MEQCGYLNEVELGSNPAFGVLLAGSLEQVTSIFESIFCRLILQDGGLFGCGVYATRHIGDGL